MCLLPEKLNDNLVRTSDQLIRVLASEMSRFIDDTRIKHVCLTTAVQHFQIAQNKLQHLTSNKSPHDLTDLSQLFKVIGVLSTPQLLMGGVLQGSVLGPLLLTMYTTLVQ